MPRATNWAEVLHVSKSQLTTYLQCPKRFWFQYVVGQPWEFVPSNLPFGRAVHEAVAFFYRQVARNQTKPDLADVLERFREEWWSSLEREPIRFFGGQDEQMMTTLGEQLLSVFHTDIRPRRVRAVEEPFTVDIQTAQNTQPLEVKLVGMIDLLEEDDTGHVIVVELKTSSKRYSDIQGEHQLDGLVYSYAAHRLGLKSDGVGELLIRYDVLVKTKQPVLQQVFFTKSPADLDRLVIWIDEILRAINAEVFYPNYGWQCQQCPFQRPCWQKP
jgi:putative RecB family exonuclease